MGKVCSEPIPNEMRIRRNMTTLPICNVYMYVSIDVIAHAADEHVCLR